MKLDMDLGREILRKLEDDDKAIGHGWVELTFDDRSGDEVSYHVRLLHEAGLIEARNLSVMGPTGFCWKAERLTWAGHQFLEASREEGLWQKAKQIAKEKAGGLSFDVLKTVLIQLAIDAAKRALS